MHVCNDVQWLDAEAAHSTSGSTMGTLLLAGSDAGRLTRIPCSLMNYFVSDLGLIPAVLSGVAAAAKMMALFSVLAPSGLDAFFSSCAALRVHVPAV